MPETERDELALELEDSAVAENAAAESLAAFGAHGKSSHESKRSDHPNVGDTLIAVSAQAEMPLEHLTIDKNGSNYNAIDKDMCAQTVASENAEAAASVGSIDSYSKPERPILDQKETPNSCSSSIVADDKPDVQVVTPSPLKNPSKAAAEESVSFAAVGSGDGEEAMAGLLDMVADVTTEMSSGGNGGAVTTEITTSTGESDRLILDEVDSSCSDSWCVVSAEERNQNEGPTQQEEIARATEMLGSVIFNSDLKGSPGDAVSILSGSDSVPSSFSVPSSVPSVPSLLTPVPPSEAAHHPWDTHLSQLRELGFSNESKNLGILEQLADHTSARPEDLSFSQVINEILQEFKQP